MLIAILSELSEEEHPNAGAKALTLARLIRAGFPVPPGRVLFPEAFAGEWLSEAGRAAPDRLPPTGHPVRIARPHHRCYHFATALTAPRGALGERQR